MGRSKFPGKPAKHVNRKRINVLPPPIAIPIPTNLNAAVVVGYNSTVTVTVSSETDEDTKQVSVCKENDSSYNGTSVPKSSDTLITSETHRIPRRIPRRRRRRRKRRNNKCATTTTKIGTATTSASMTASTSTSTTTTTTTTTTTATTTTTNIIMKNRGVGVTKKNNHNVVTAKSIKNNNVNTTSKMIPIRKSVRGFATGRTLTTRKQSLSLLSSSSSSSSSAPSSVLSSSSLSSLVSRESNNLVGKFVLPTRSVHSSRVIKPNKRFINMELAGGAASASTSASATNGGGGGGASVVGDDTRTIKKRVICNNKRHVIKTGDNDKPNKTIRNKCLSSSRFDNVKREKGNKGISEEDGSDSNNHHQQSPFPNNNNNNNSNSNSSSNNSNNRIVLRQARLQLHTQTPSGGPEGPFSSSNTTTTSPPGTVTCGVCGAVRFYRFVKQARKFKIYSCESCRKFISKMIKRRQSCAKNMNSVSTLTLVCHKGQGMCHVPPIVRSQQWKLIRCAYKARCPACWLKMCLRSFHMPITLKNSLAQLLPKNMQGPELMFNNSLPLLSWQAQSQSQSQSQTDSIEKPLENLEQQQQPQQQKQRCTRLKSTKNCEKATPTASCVVGIVVHPTTATVSSTTTTSVTATTASTSTATGAVVSSANTEIKRQKVDLKGPRVKHVCRSASIVLGQPLATFPNVSTEKTKDIVESKTQETKLSVTSEGKFESCIENVSSTVSSFDNNLDTFLPEKTAFKQSSRRDREKYQIHQNSSSTNSFSEQYQYKSNQCSKKSNTEPQNTISIDYWESYDPDEICRSGFSIMASEPFPMAAICYLCGSAGQEQLLHCSLCCEPYHPYCLEQSPPYHLTCINWLCPRCTTCSDCNQPDRTKISCQKCHKVYHPECFNNKWSGTEKPSICSRCLQCKSCGTDNNITKFVGNLPLCVMCFKLRKKGNYCPLCQRCYDDNDFDTMMMECSKCNKWIHSKCEGLSDEQYQILSMLPESVEFLCRLCSGSATPYWKKALKVELKACFSNILRLLSKNNMARNMLKWSPINNNNSPNHHHHHHHHRAINSAKKLQFSSSSSDNNDLDCTTTVTQNIFKESINDDSEESLSSRNIHPSMIDVKNRLNSNDYSCVTDFNQDMIHALSSTHSEQILEIYYLIVEKVFPWYNPKLIRTCAVAKTQTLQTEPMNTDTNESEKSLSLLNSSSSSLSNLTNTISDTRTCVLCKGIGDGGEQMESRLLYCGQNEWVHANCALWSSEVYEEIDGSLQNVHSALSRGRSIKCAYCKQKGASVGCCLKGCYETYHFNCARMAKCSFMHDKTVYCATHDISNNHHNMLVHGNEFEIRRAVYVELDRKKKKIVEIDRIHFMVGSLTVTKLGKIVPFVSDQEETIIPSGFVCSRLYWSTTEPWKLVSYVVTTSVLTSQINTVFIDKNFTVDHSLPKSVVDKKLKDILLWQRDLLTAKTKSDLLDYEDEEEPQNAADLLSPELTDAILEELPYDILDGISVQDIFPKLNCEELYNMDFKSEISNNDNTDFLKKVPTDLIDDDNDSNLSARTGRELKRSKSELFPQLNTKTRSQQRSCSLTLSCKLDSSLAPAIKKRKITSRDSGVFFQLLQVDGAYDSSSSASECGGSPIHEIEDPWEPKEEPPVTCERCQCTYRTQASYKRHLENCEVISTSESDSEFIREEHQEITHSHSDYAENKTLVVNVAESQEPYVIASYKTFSTFQTTQKQLHATTTSTIATTTTITPTTSSSINPSVVNTQNYANSKEEEEEVGEEDGRRNVSTEILPVIADHENLFYHDLSVKNSLQSKPKFSINQPALITVTSNQNPYCVNSTTIPVCVSTPTNTIHPVEQTNSVLPVEIQTHSIPNAISVHQPISYNPDGQGQTILSLPNRNQVTIEPSHNILNASCPSVINSIVTTQAVNVPQNQWIKPVVKQRAAIVTQTQKSVKATKSKPRSLAAKRGSTRLPGPSGTVLIPQTNTTTTPMIVQHLPSPNVVSTFVDPFQPQTGQNLQYVATISPQINSTITQQSPIIQLQPDGSFISLVPSVQPTMLIQQPRVLTDQLILDSNGTLTWATQPIYYGFETIVQNTVMQSQQFLPTTVPGVLTANSSYSTTTQVFQTSKLEPVLDVSSNSFVLVNSGHLVNPQQVHPVPAPLAQAIPLQSGGTTTTTTTTTATTSTTTTNTTNTTNTTTTHMLPSQNAPPNLKNKEVNVAKIVYQSTPSTKKSVVPHPVSTSTVASINSLPVVSVAPFVSDQGIPTIVVTPTPKVITTTTTTQIRPMSRVLPMQTSPIKDIKKPIEKLSQEEKELTNPVGILNKFIDTFENIDKENTLRDVIKKEELLLSNRKFESETTTTTAKLENSPFKLIFQKQTQEGIYKISNSFASKNQSSLQVVPLKPIKSKTQQQQQQQQQMTPSPQLPLALSSPPPVPVVVNGPPTPPLTASPLPLPSTPPLQLPLPSPSPSPSPPPSPPMTPHPHNITNNNNNNNNKKEAPRKHQSSLPPPPELKLLSTAQETRTEPMNNGPSILYTIETQDGFRYSSTSVTDLWGKVFEAVQAARIAHNMEPLPVNAFNMINNLQLLGLKANGLKYLLEQLPGAGKCVKYKPNFFFAMAQNDADDEFCGVGHTFGSIRCAPYSSRSEPNDMFGWLASKHRKPENNLIDMELFRRRGAVTNLPMAMRFRQLKLTSKMSVGVYRSSIHRRGLFCLRDIEAGEMVIEYAGEVIRSVLTDKREKYYNSKGIGCYMFRIDDNLVVDATMKGNAARFINHSCDPNCYSKVVEILGHKHIIIFALRKILCGEELTYDYKFPFEEDKIPCTCNARRCRKFLN